MTDFVFELPGDAERLRARLRPRKNLLDRSLLESISRIFRNVEAAGDHEIRLATLQFDEVEIDSVFVSDDYADHCISELSTEFRAAMRSKGAPTIAGRMAAAAGKMAAKYAPFSAALSSLTLPARVADPMQNIDNRLKPVVKLMVDTKKAQG